MQLSWTKFLLLTLIAFPLITLLSQKSEFIDFLVPEIRNFVVCSKYIRCVELDRQTFYTIYVHLPMPILNRFLCTCIKNYKNV